MNEHLRRACNAVVILTTAGEERVAGVADQDDLIDQASDELAQVVGDGEAGLAALLFLLDTAVSYAAAVSEQSASHTVRRICDIAVQASELSETRGTQ